MMSPFTEGYNTVQKGITTVAALKVKVINNISVPFILVINQLDAQNFVLQ